MTSKENCARYEVIQDPQPQNPAVGPVLATEMQQPRRRSRRSCDKRLETLLWDAVKRRTTTDTLGRRSAGEVKGRKSGHRQRGGERAGKGAWARLVSCSRGQKRRIPKTTRSTISDSL